MLWIHFACDMILLYTLPKYSLGGGGEKSGGEGMAREVKMHLFS
jgi:hypothetical protein